MQRLLTLRKFPGLADADLGELAIIAENVVEQTFPAGAIVASAARRVPGEKHRAQMMSPSGPALYLVTSGKLISASGKHWGQHEVCGALQAMAGRRTTEDILAEVESTTLRLTAADFREILEDNFGLLSAVRRTLARELLTLSLRPPSQDETKVLLPEVTTDSPLGMVERLMVLRKRLPFGKGRIEALAALSQSADEIRVPARTDLATAGEPVTAVTIILEGTAQVIRPDGQFVFGPGSSIGAFESLGEAPLTASVTTLTPVRALRFPVTAFLDVLEDHTDLALAMVERLATTLLEQAPNASMNSLVERPQVN
ncbi:MAG TPA: cyclic nucleotide-binding domain-containing protein [Kofleriaceae bacterium]